MSKTVDESFPSNQLAMFGYIFITTDRQIFGGGIVVYIDFEILIKEITKNKGLVVGIYKPPNLDETYFNASLEIIKIRLSNTFENSFLNSYGRFQSDCELSDSEWMFEFVCTFTRKYRSNLL